MREELGFDRRTIPSSPHHIQPVQLGLGWDVRKKERNIRISRLGLRVRDCGGKECLPTAKSATNRDFTHEQQPQLSDCDRTSVCKWCPNAPLALFRWKRDGRAEWTRMQAYLAFAPRSWRLLRRPRTNSPTNYRSTCVAGGWWLLVSRSASPAVVSSAVGRGGRERLVCGGLLVRCTQRHSSGRTSAARVRPSARNRKFGRLVGWMMA